MQREHKSSMLKTLKSFMQKKQTEGIREKTIKKEQTVLPIIERKTGRLIREEEYGQKAIYFLYHHFIGRVLLKLIFARPYFSFLRGLYYNSFLSKKEIAPFVEKYGLPKEYLKKNYNSFGAFFSRKEAVYLRDAGKENTKDNGEDWKEKIRENGQEKGREKGREGQQPFYATASGKLLAYKIDQEGGIVLPEKSDSKKESSTKGSTKNCAKGLTGLQEDATRKDRPNERQNERQNERKASNPLPLEIKGNLYSIEKILKAPCPEFLKGGTLLVFRLSLPDYHRYIFPARGKLLRTKKIKGRLDSVRKEAAHFKAFSENKREISLLELSSMGKILHVEVGAMLVGHIHNHVGCKPSFDKVVECHKEKGTECCREKGNIQISGKNHLAHCFAAGEEKGYFSLGGSTIVEMLNDKIVIDDDLFENTNKGLETKLEIGERIGYGKA